MRTHAPYSIFISVLLALMNEYYARPHEDRLYEERVHNVQLAYAPYTALLPSFDVTSLLGRLLEGSQSFTYSPEPQGLTLRNIG